MNISEIKTVNDLLNANKAQENNTDFGKSQQLLKQVYKLDPAYGKAIATHIMENLLGFHMTMVQENLEAKDMEYAMIWQADSIKLDQAITLLKEVTLKNDDGDVVEIDEI